MSNRILILDAAGKAITALDGHHGAAHAANFAATMLSRLHALGIDAVVVEVTPEQGGDAMRRDVIGNLHRLRAEFHRRPDGKRELVGLALFPEATPDERVMAKQGIGAGLGKAQAAATAAPVRGSLRLLAAPGDVHGTRHAIRIPRGRMNPAPGQPRTATEARQARRLARANARPAR